MKSIFFTLLFLSSLAHSFENLGSSSSALGGAGVGALDRIDGAFNNPSTIALFPTRVATFSGGSKHFRTSFADNGAEALFPAMLGYSQTDINNIKSKTFFLGVAHAFSKRWSLGANFGLQEMKIAEKKYKQTVVDTGILYRFTSKLSTGLVWKNKPLTDTDLADSIDQRPTWALGMDYIYMDIIGLRLEVESGKNAASDEKMIFKYGTTFLLNEWIVAKIGYQNDNIASQNYFTAGLGFNGPQFGLHYAYVKESEFKKETHHSIDLVVPF